jgi:hypothetical protein
MEPRRTMFAQGFLAGAVSRQQGLTGASHRGGEAVSTAPMTLTVGCAEVYDHMYDPISEGLLFNEGFV